MGYELFMRLFLSNVHGRAGSGSPSRVRSALQGLLAAVVLALVACAPLEPETTPASQALARAAVAMPDRFSAQAAADVLAAGGNAVDAAVAAAFVLAVTYPEAGNIGGGGFMLIYVDGKPSFVDYREVAPAAANRDMYLDDSGEVIEGLSLVGAKAAGVPGTVAGMWAAHQRFGSKPWNELLAPAIALAADGFELPAHLVDRIAEEMPVFRGRTNFDEYFGGLSPGERFRQVELAATLGRISVAGPAGFYGGDTARLIVAQMERGGGIVSAADLENYEAVWREPLQASWRDYRILSAPPPSSGGFGVIQLLKMKDYLTAAFAGLEHNSPQYIHLVAELEKRVFADRAKYLGDPDFVSVPIDALLSDEYLKSRARQVRPRAISPLETVPPGLESSATTHFSILDRWGNAVSNTYTLNAWFGSGVVVHGAGFLLNNEMDDFSVKPGVPNLYGVVGDTANEIQPGKRMLSSMSPTILLEGDRVSMVVGTPGGSTIFTSVFQTIVNILDFDMSPQEATAKTRFHHQLLPPDLVTYSVTRPLPQQTIEALAARGYRAGPHSFEFGDVQVIQVQDGLYRTGADPRGRGESRVLP